MSTPAPKYDVAKVARHQELLDAMNETYKNKNADYGDSFGKTYKELGIISAATQIEHKNNRFKQLAKGHESLVPTESIKDTLLDMANYCIMTIMSIEEERDES